MKYLKDLVKILLLTVAGIGTVYLIITSGLCDKYITRYISYLLQNRAIESKIDDFKIGYSSIGVGRLFLKFGNDKNVEIKDLKINHGFSLKKKFDLSYNISLSTQDLRIINDKDSVIEIPTTAAQYDYSLRNYSSGKIDVNSIKGNFFDSSRYQDNKIRCYASRADLNLSNLNASCAILIDNKKALQTEVTMTPFAAKMEVKTQSLPSEIYQLFRPVLGANSIFMILDNSLNAGIIEKGSAALEINRKTATLNSLSGSFKAKDVEYDYYDSFPKVKDASGELILNNDGIIINVADAKLAGSTKAKGTISFNIPANDQTLKVRIKASGTGGTIDILEFVPDEQIQEMKDAKMDMHTAAGDANTKVDLLIFPFEDTPTKYDISSVISDFSWTVLDQNIFIDATKINANFDGNILKLSTDSGVINNYQSKVNYTLDTNILKQKLDVRTNLKAIENGADSAKWGFAEHAFSALGGSAHVDFIYETENAASKMLIKSDLTGLDYEIENTSINNKAGQKSTLLVRGDFKNKSSKIDFKLTGDDKLDIDAALNSKGGGYNEINIKKFQYQNKYSFGGNIRFQQNMIDLNLSGTSIDLSEFDFSEIELSDSASALGKNIDINFDQMIMKNDISFDNFAFHLNCDSTKCYQGYADSDVGDKPLKLMLSSFEDRENWIFKCGNAGDFLSGAGFSDKIQDGELYILLDIHSPSTIKGDRIGIEKNINGKGEFYLDKFKMVKTPFITKLLSLTSLPGFLNILDVKNQIPFKNFYGDLSINNSKLTIEKSSALGAFFNFSLKGDIDHNNRKIEMKGVIYPSVYYISSIISRVPLINKFVGGKRRGIISAPFSVSEEY